MKTAYILRACTLAIPHAEAHHTPAVVVVVVVAVILVLLVVVKHTIHLHVHVYVHACVSTSITELYGGSIQGGRKGVQPHVQQAARCQILQSLDAY